MMKSLYNKVMKTRGKVPFNKRKNIDRYIKGIFKIEVKVKFGDGWEMRTDAQKDVEKFRKILFISNIKHEQPREGYVYVTVASSKKWNHVKKAISSCKLAVVDGWKYGSLKGV